MSTITVYTAMPINSSMGDTFHYYIEVPINIYDIRILYMDDVTNVDNIYCVRRGLQHVF